MILLLKLKKEHITHLNNNNGVCLTGGRERKKGEESLTEFNPLRWTVATQTT